jgi:hypothetical protein
MTFFARAFSGEAAALALLTAIDRVGTAQPLQPGDEDALHASEQGWPQHARDAGLDYRGGAWALADDGGTVMYRAFVQRKNAARAAWHADRQSSVYRQLDDKVSELRARSGGGADGESAGSGTRSDGVLLAGSPGERPRCTSRPQYAAPAVIAAMRSVFSTFNLSASALLFGIQRACALQASKAPGLVYWYLDKADIGAKGSAFCDDVLELLTRCGFVPSEAPVSSGMERGEQRDGDTLVWTLVPGTWTRSGLRRVAKASLSSMVVQCSASGRTEVVRGGGGFEFTFAQETGASSVCGEWCTIL